MPTESLLSERFFKFSKEVHKPLIVGAAILTAVGIGSVSTLILLLGGYAISSELAKPKR